MKLFHLYNLKHMVRCYPESQELVPVIGNWSAAMQHFGLNDEPIWISLEPASAAAQVWTVSNAGGEAPVLNATSYATRFSVPVPTGEAGFYWDSAVQRYYTYVDVSRLTADQVASIGTPEDEVVWAQGLETCPPSLPKE